MSKRKSKGFKKLQEIGFWHIVLPMVLGVGVVLFVIYRDFDREAFETISWNERTIFWVSVTIFAYILRHIALTWRLQMISDYYFSFKKSVQLIFLWEFASTISPTALGGSATALILLSQERFPGGKAVAVILYSVVLDTLFFVICLPLFLFIIGPEMIRPGIETLRQANGFDVTFYIVLSLMTTYGFFFFYGLFINPKQLKRILYWISKWRILRRFRADLQQTAENVILASKELQKKDWKFHVKCMFATSLAWVIRFSVIAFLIFAFLQVRRFYFDDFILLWSRFLTMFSFTAFSPTPGGTGVAEALFGGFYKDYVAKENAMVIALIWRFITDYSYLLIGAVILPNWIAYIIKQRIMRKQERTLKSDSPKGDKVNE